MTTAYLLVWAPPYNEDAGFHVFGVFPSEAAARAALEDVPARMRLDTEVEPFEVGRFHVFS